MSGKNVTLSCVLLIGTAFLSLGCTPLNKQVTPGVQEARLSQALREERHARIIAETRAQELQRALSVSETRLRQSWEARQKAKRMAVAERELERLNQDNQVIANDQGTLPQTILDTRTGALGTAPGPSRVTPESMVYFEPWQRDSANQEGHVLVKADDPQPGEDQSNQDQRLVEHGKHVESRASVNQARRDRADAAADRMFNDLDQIKDQEVMNASIQP